jgi:hypothetical protein
MTNMHVSILILVSSSDDKTKHAEESKVPKCTRNSVTRPLATPQIVEERKEHMRSKRYRKLLRKHKLQGCTK